MFPPTFAPVYALRSPYAAMPAANSALIKARRTFSIFCNNPPLFHAHASNFEATALVTLKGVQIARSGFGSYSKQDHLSLALGTEQQRFNRAQFGRLSH